MDPLSDLPDAAPRPSDRRDPPGGRLGPAVAVIACFLLTAVLVAGFVVRVPYIIISPGSAVPLDEDIVSVSGTRSYGQSGDLLFLTVLESTRDPSVWRWLLAKLDGDVHGRAEQVHAA